MSRSTRCFRTIRPAGELRSARKKGRQADKDRRKRKNNLQNALMQLRKICNHPFVFPEVDDDFSTGTAVDEQIVRVSGKFELLDRILPKLFATGHKVSFRHRC